MTFSETNAGRLSAAVYTGVSLLAATAFLLVTLTTGDYTWVARLGGAFWIFLLSMIILMPTVTPWLRARAARRVTPVGPATTSSATRAQPIVEVSEMVKDPVCGMEIDPAAAAGSSQYNGRTYYFCNLSCKRSFDEDPLKYVAG